MRPAARSTFLRLGAILGLLLALMAAGARAEEPGTVLMPGEESRLLTRELFYTAVTRARDRLRVVGSEDAVRHALGRRALRATGLRQRLATDTHQ